MTQELTVMAEGGITLVEMTPQEAEAAVTMFVSHGTSMRHLLLEMHERKAHKALGFDSFEGFAQERLGLNPDKSYLSNQVRWARIEQVIASQSEEAVPVPRLSRRTAYELAKLPTSELVQEAWNRYQQGVPSGSPSASQSLERLKGIVEELNPIVIDWKGWKKAATLLLQIAERGKRSENPFEGVTKEERRWVVTKLREFVQWLQWENDRREGEGE